MSGKKGMKQYSAELVRRIKELNQAGLSHREVGAAVGLSREQVKWYFKRVHRKEREIAAGRMPQPKGRPRKNGTATPEQEMARLRMENELLRSFLQAVGRM